MNEVTFITLGYDKVLYNQLKDKIKFSKVFIENMGKPFRTED